MKISYRQAISNKLGYFGIFVGLYCAFVIRDEYYYSSVTRISDLIRNHDVHANALEEERSSLLERINVLELKEKQRKKSLKKGVKNSFSKKEVA
jgi:hypothetical protein